MPADLLLGPTAVAFGNGNLPAVAKVVQGFQKENADLFIVKGGVLAGSVFKAKDLEAIASLPTLDEIHAQLAGSDRAACRVAGGSAQLGDLAGRQRAASLLAGT